MTPAAADFLRILENRIVLFEAKLDTAPDAYARGLYAGWKTATEEVLREARAALERVEAEAALVPEVEEDFGSLRERLLAEEMAI